MRTARGTYTAGQLVICPGAWAPQLLAEFGIPITIERQVLYWLDPVGGTAPFVDHPIFIDENAHGEQIYGFPAIDGPGGGVKVAFFRKGIVCTPETIDRTVHEDEIREMRDRVAELLPALNGRCLDSATCMYSNTPDQHFVIARHPDSANVTVACGFSGHGFKFVPVVGEILADLATDRVDEPPDFVVRPTTVGDDMTATDQPSTLLATLGGAYYTSESVFAAEQSQILESMWFCAARSADMANPGQFKKVQVGSRERAGCPRPRRHAAGVPQRLQAPRRAVVH